jgi:hypothetical protein
MQKKLEKYVVDLFFKNSMNFIVQFQTCMKVYLVPSKAIETGMILLIMDIKKNFYVYFL